MTTEDVQGCWLDVFELSHFRGRRRRLFGPNIFPSIRSHSTAWGVAIDSMIVGHAAHVRIYSAADEKGTLLWLLPRQVIGDVADLRIDDSADSLQIHKIAPVYGELGYDAYTLALQRSQMHG